MAGVCGGLADWLGWPPALVRILFVAGSLLPVLPGPLLYLVLWLAVPIEPSLPPVPQPPAGASRSRRSA